MVQEAVKVYPMNGSVLLSCRNQLTRPVSECIDMGSAVRTLDSADIFGQNAHSFNGARGIIDKGGYTVEIWKAVPGVENIEVSQYGNVRNSKTGKLRKQTLGHKNSRTVKVLDRGVYANRLVHALVMAAHVGARPDGYIIDHKDRDRSNNNLSNLHYVTHGQNQRNRVDQLCEGGKPVIDVLSDMFGFHDGKVYSRIASNMRNGKTFQDALDYEFNKYGWPEPAKIAA